MHRHILHNEEICDAARKVFSAGQVGLLSGWGVFSTIKAVDGVLFAWERHWARMKRDAALLRVPFPPNAGEVHALLLKLLDANGVCNATLRISVVRNRGGLFEGPGIERDYDLVAFAADVKDWGEGVRLAVAPRSRSASTAFAGTKILSWAMNLACLEDAQSRGFDEVILFNERDEVSECTSANIFIAQGNRVWTPPLRSGCLPGVTRDLLLTEIETRGVEVGERDLRLEDLREADEVFITSTTRDLLPVLAVEGIEVRQSPGPRLALEKAFSAYVASYIAAHKEAFASPREP